MSAAANLRAAVQSLLGGRVDSFDAVREDVDYDAFLAHRAVARLRGTARVAGELRTWSLIEKTTDGHGCASPYLRANGERELRAYHSPIISALGPHIRAPRCHGTATDADGRITLWLEDVAHVGTRPLDADTILAAAFDLGGLAGRWVGRPLKHPWLFRGWLDRHGQPEAVAPALALLGRLRPDAAARLPGGADALTRLVLAQGRVRTVLTALPHTLCHHDAVGANVIRTGGGTVLIDWESIGPGPVGADLASLLFASVRRGDASLADVGPLLSDAVDAYVAGARGETSALRAADVRWGLDAAIALRWKLGIDVAASLQCGTGTRRGSRPDESPNQALAELVGLTGMLLAAADRALSVA